MERLDLIKLLVEQTKQTLKYRKRSVALAQEVRKLNRELWAQKQKIERLHAKYTWVGARGNVK
jgi:hypothetical protein